jgi:hypothetical protein
MRKVVVVIGASALLAASAGSAAFIWRRNPRIGTRFVNTVVNPGLLRRGLTGRGSSELGTLEHVGRNSGIRRLTPVHPEPTAEGFRILVPLGPRSEWARNVLAAKRCRLQLHDLVYDLDEPTMVPANGVDDVFWALRGVMAALGFHYLKLRAIRAKIGTLEAQVAALPHAGANDVRSGTGPRPDAKPILAA